MMESVIDNERLKLESEFHTDFPPGTELMVDSGSHNFIKSAPSSHVVLVPQPSQDPHDPLNWSRLWKASAIACVTLNSFMQGMGPLALAPIFPELMQSFDHSLPDVVQFSGVTILVLGFSNFIWVPMSETFGRRSVLILSGLITFGSTIWRAEAKSYASFMGACVLNGISAGPGETIQPAVLADVCFLHERGRQSTLYFAFYFASLMIGPIIAGPMATQVGWRNYWWLEAGLMGLTVVLTLVGFPETRFDRDDTLISSAAPSRLKHADAEVENSDMPSADEKNTNNSQGPTIVANDPYLRRGGPSKGQFKLWQTPENLLKTLAIAIWLPWKLLLFPIVEFAAFVVSWTASMFLLTNVTQSQAFSGPPWSFSSQTIGFLNFATLVGAAIGLITAGPLSDWFSMRATKRNNGIREPEMRLPTIIPYLILNVLGNFMMAFGYQHGWPWEPIVIIGYACAGIQVAALPAIASAYAIDSYKPSAGSIFVAITVNKNLWGYGITKFVPNWIISSGYVKPIMLNMSLTVLWCLFGVVFYYYGKTFRRWTKNSNAHQSLQQWIAKRR